MCTPWLWAYWPVKSVERDGQQSEVLTMLLLKVTPAFPIRRRVLGRNRIVSAVWSSVISITILGA